MSEDYEEDAAHFRDPQPLGLIVCDGISRDLATGKFSLIGMIGGIVTPMVPARANFAAFATLTNIRENLELKFILVDDNDEVIAKIPPEDGWIQLEKPPDLMVEAIIMGHFSGVEFPKYGSYFIQVWTKKRSIMERRILVLEPSPPQEEQKS